MCDPDTALNEHRWSHINNRMHFSFSRNKIKEANFKCIHGFFFFFGGFYDFYAAFFGGVKILGIRLFMLLMFDVNISPCLCFVLKTPSL